jgi:hypothetical protein
VKDARLGNVSSAVDVQSDILAVMGKVEDNITTGNSTVNRLCVGDISGNHFQLVGRESSYTRDVAKTMHVCPNKRAMLKNQFFDQSAANKTGSAGYQYFSS